MKKILLYSMVALSLAFLPSCLKDDKQLFDESPAVRLDKSVAQAKQILESAPNGWVMDYYAGKDYTGAGYTLLMKFADGKVMMMGDNKDPETIGESSYDVVKDQGPVLTFPTFNEVIHDLASASLGYPEGIQGDYEFTLIEVSPERIRLRGKKWKNDMVLTPLPSSLSFEEAVEAVFTIREGMTSNAYDFILAGETLAQGEVNVDSRHLTVTIESNSYDIPYTITPTGLQLQRPLVVGGKSYSSFTWNEEAKSFTEGDLTLKLYVPASHKPIDFWYGSWVLSHDAVRGNRRTTLTLSQGSSANLLEGTLTFMNVTYRIPAIPYDPATGTISFVGQPINDPRNRYPGGILLVPVSAEDNNKLLETDHRITFTWDEDSNVALAQGSEMADGKVDSFFGAAYGADLQPMQDAQGRPIFVINLSNIRSIRKTN